MKSVTRVGLGAAAAIVLLASYTCAAEARGFGFGGRAIGFGNHWGNQFGLQRFWGRHFWGAHGLGAATVLPAYGDFGGYQSNTIACTPSQEIITVPAERGGRPVQITINRCN